MFARSRRLRSETDPPTRMCWELDALQDFGVERYEVAVAQGASGEHRGGNGIRKLAPNCTFSALGRLVRGQQGENGAELKFQG
jgi:hypothetical protein